MSSSCSVVTRSVVGVTVIALVIATMLSTMILPRATRAAVDDPIAAAVPDTAWLLINVTTDLFGEQAMLADMLMDRAGIGASIDDAIARGPGWEQWNDVFSAARPFLGGEAAIFLDQSVIPAIVDASAGRPVPTRYLDGIGLILSASDPAATADALAALIDDGSTTAAAPVNLEGRFVYAITDSAPDGMNGFLVPLDEVVAITLSEATALSVIASATGDEASLADSDAYARFTSVLPEQRLGMVYTNPEQILSMMRDVLAAQRDLTQQERALAEQFLFAAPPNPTVAVLWADPEGFRLRQVTNASRDPKPPVTDASSSLAPDAVSAAAHELTVTSYDIYFDPKEVSIPADTDVKLTLPNEGAAPHNFSIDALNVSVNLSAGVTAETTVNAAAGDYEYYCNVPGHKEAGMVGTLTAVAGDGTAAPAGSAPAASAPADTVLFAAGSDLGASPALRALLPMLDVAASDPSSGMGAPVSSLLGFDIGEDLLYHLTGQWAVAGRLQLLANPPFTLSMTAETDDPVALAETMAKVNNVLLQQGALDTTFRESVMQGGTIYSLAVDLDTEYQDVPIEWGVLNDRMVLTFGLLVDNVLKPPSSSLADAPRYQAAMAHFPEERTYESYLDIQPMIALANMAISSNVPAGTLAPPTLALSWIAAAAWQEDDLAINEVMIGIP